MTNQTHTPGRWHWNMNLKGKRVTLESTGVPGHMHEIVLDFVRWGMGGAAPRFRRPHPARPSLVLMERCEEFAEPLPGREHHADWFRVLNHPDALLIAAAPDLLAACVKAAQWVRDGQPATTPNVLADLESAIVRATKG